MKFPKPPMKPIDLEQRQAWFERRQKALDMRKTGATFEQIGTAFGVTGSQARILVVSQEWRSLGPSPVEKWEQKWAVYQARALAWAETQQKELDAFVRFINKPMP